LKVEIESQSSVTGAKRFFYNCGCSQLIESEHLLVAVKCENADE